MRILALEGAIFGVEDLDEAARFCSDFGLACVLDAADAKRFETQDGSVIELRPSDSAELPAPIQPGSGLREAIWGVPDTAAIEEIECGLAADRAVRWDGGRLHSVDAEGLGIAFQVTRKRSYEPRHPAANIPGHFQRPLNSRIDFKRDVKPIGIAHLVLNCENELRERAFYLERLGFKLSDELRGSGALYRSSLVGEHHNMFTVQRPPRMLNHVAFYVTDFHDVMLGGMHMLEKGWVSRWGPGRHKLGSNYFWYIQSPLGGAMEYTCDVDHVTDDWVPGMFEPTPDMSNIWSSKDFPAV